MPSYQQVDVYVRNRADNNAPLQGVVVRVFDEAGVALYGDSITDADGRAGFLLYTRKYTLRFYLLRGRFQQPQHIEVIEGLNGAVAANAFDVFGEVLPAPHAVDPHLCRASGYFRDITGAPRKGLDLFFIGEFAPLLLDGAGVLSERRAVTTDEEGYACLDLVRCGKYAVTVENLEDATRHVDVPDSPSVNLPDLLFPVAAEVSFDPPSPWQTPLAASLEVSPTVFTSTGIPLPNAGGTAVRYELEDPSIATLVPKGDVIEIRPRARGTTRLLVTRRDLSIVTIPFSAELKGSGQTVTVT